ncbi:unnamed protein product [Echinostoma caproni]|uniref:Inhibitor_I29 domain-containing protein n=1 Tax=Echinostoma caproni TaxID=27848 RepID=A0A183ATP0_9TREM|nr:unnamed protein product [Echinostoma caproni]
MFVTNVILVTLLVPGLFAVSNAIWMEWKQKYNRQYASGEQEATRRTIWEKTAQRIQDHNLRYDLGLEKYQKGLNNFSDMNFDEI